MLLGNYKALSLLPNYGASLETLHSLILNSSVSTLC